MDFVKALPVIRHQSQHKKPRPDSYPKNPVSIGDQIRKRRMDLKLLQKDLGKLFGVTEDCITNWERNRNVPQIQFYPHIISFLGYLPFEFDEDTLSGRMKTYRHIHGLNQMQLAKILKVDPSTVCSWELGEKRPKKGVLEALDRLLKGKTVKIAVQVSL